MKTKRLLSLFLALMAAMLAFGGVNAAASDVLEHPDFDQIDQYIQSQMKDCRIPGFSLGIVRDGELLYLKGYGRADDTDRAATPQTPFLVGSVSKTFTALAVMQLYEAGKIDLDKPVQQYLPSFTLADEPAAGKITVRMLLNHTSGIETDAEYQVSTLRGDDETMAELAARFEDIKPAHQPGTKFAYGNVNYITLGLLIEQISGLPYETYIQQNIFDPLEMRHSYTSAADAAKDGLAMGYYPYFGVPAKSNLPYRMDFMSAYSIISCAEDMTHYMMALQNGGRYKDKQVLSQETVELMTTASSEISKWMSYGLGWYVTSGSFYHGGELPDYQAKVRFLPEDGLGVALMYNTSSSTLATLFNVGYRDRIESGIINVLYGFDPEDQPGQSPLNLNSYPVSLSYTLLQVLAGLTVLLIILSAFRLRKLQKRLHKSKAAAKRITAFTVLIHLALPVAILAGIPAFAKATWAFVLLYIPDMGWFALCVSVALLIIGLLKAYYILLHFSRQASA